MKARFFSTLVVAAAGLAGCAADPSATPPGPAYDREIQAGRPGLFGDLRWNIDLTERREAAERSSSENAGPMSAAE
jgi:hypothetical protein